MRTIKLAPSILTADFSKLFEEIRAIERGGADLVHLDVMDGQFVPPITFGADIVTAIAKITNLPIEVHLMVTNPEQHIESFSQLEKNWFYEKKHVGITAGTSTPEHVIHDAHVAILKIADEIDLEPVVH